MIGQIPRFYQFLDRMEKAKSPKEYAELVDEFGATLENYPNPAAAETIKALAQRIFAVAQAVSKRLNSFTDEQWERIFVRIEECKTKEFDQMRRAGRRPLVEPEQPLRVIRIDREWALQQLWEEPEYLEEGLKVNLEAPIL